MKTKNYAKKKKKKTKNMPIFHAVINEIQNFHP